MSRSSRSLPLVLLPLLVASPLWAQAPRWEVDVNASRIQYDTAATLNAPSASGLLEWRRPSLFGRLSGSVTGFEGAGWSSQGRGDLAGWLAPAGRSSPIRFELAGTGSASRHSSGFASYLGRADARLHLTGGTVGGWAGAGGVVAKNSSDVEAVNALVPSVGLWAQSRALRATASYVHTTFSGESYPEGNLVLSTTRGPLDLTLYGGFRAFPATELDAETWIGGSAAYWFDARAAVVLSGGQYSSDILQGLPGGEFISIGIRLTSRRDRPIPRRVPAPLVYNVETVRERGITLSVPGADRVEIAGDFNGWTLEPLRKGDDGAWVVPDSLEPGVYRFNLRVDGEKWTVPEGVPSVDDGFGDRVGLLIISEGD